MNAIKKRMLFNLAKHIDSCGIADALDATHLKGVALGLHHLGPGGRICGRVVPMRVSAGSSSQVHLGVSAILQAEPGEIIVVAAGGRTDVAAWGGLLSLAALQHGVKGVIVDGAVRDVEESDRLGLPIFARGAIPLSARGRLAEQNCGEPVMIAGVPVQTGDWVIADASGVVFVPEAQLDRVLDAAASIVARERELAGQIKAGMPLQEVFGHGYEQMLR